ncbi:Hypp7819 [Branchiostoma lanceolatum]|uniref:Hypp7819 protein n=1 Tax=Branchiostoma lanceolatum TaxID=7740 RepID=A0A8J9Z4B9_BRALA|nr:Hypp7819 [Branchiostoma lanceolatum]
MVDLTLKSSRFHRFVTNTPCSSLQKRASFQETDQPKTSERFQRQLSGIKGVSAWKIYKMDADTVKNAQMLVINFLLSSLPYASLHRCPSTEVYSKARIWLQEEGKMDSSTVQTIQLLVINFLIIGILCLLFYVFLETVFF